MRTENRVGSKQIMRTMNTRRGEEGDVESR